MPSAKTYSFLSLQTHFTSDKKPIIEAVQVHNNKGIKVVSEGHTVSKKKLSAKEIHNIKNRNFMPRLFHDLSLPSVHSVHLPRSQKAPKNRVRNPPHKKSLTRKGKKW